MGINTEQQTEEWFNQRQGMITASRFGVVLGGTNKAKNTYLQDLRSTERKSFESKYTAHGIRHEPNAIAEYEEITGYTVREMGFIYHEDHDRVGGSPDGFIGMDGGVEVKCPYNPDYHQEALDSGEVPFKHWPQCQGLMWICNREWWDFISYDPRRTDEGRIFIKRMERSEEYIARLEKAVLEFRNMLWSEKYYEDNN